MKILGVRIDNLNKKEILEKIEFFLSEDKPSTISAVRGKFHQIATVNPEFILKAQKDKEFKDILNECDLNVADGVGIWYAFIRNYSFLKTRIAGADLLNDVLYIANNKKLKVYLAINKDGLSSFSEIKKFINKKYPEISLSGRNVLAVEFDSFKLQNTGYDILICNFGAPVQEKFLNLQKNGNIRLVIGVGGSFDFMTGKVKRAPKIMRIMGLEWLWRLAFHPSTDKKFILNRLKKIANSVIIFPIRVTLGR